jgi:hypothetical protein
MVSVGLLELHIFGIITAMVRQDDYEQVIPNLRIGLQLVDKSAQAGICIRKRIGKRMLESIE